MLGIICDTSDMTRKQGRIRIMDLNLNEDITNYDIDIDHTDILIYHDMSLKIRFRYHLHGNHLQPYDRRWEHKV